MTQSTQRVDLLRARHRKARAQLTAEVVSAGSRALGARIAAMQQFQDAEHIAGYIAIRGEIDLAPLFEMALPGQRFYLPVLRGQQMHFAPWQLGDPLEKKGFGLLEPPVPETDWIDPAKLDLVLAPLVVFDADCNRIGQGGGFYDRTFEFVVAARVQADATGRIGKPLLMGVAHDSQREPQLQPQPWDVTLDLIVTDRAVYRSAGEPDLT